MTSTWNDEESDRSQEEAGSLGNVLDDVDREKGTFDLIAMTFLRIPRGMLVRTDEVASI